MLAGYRLFEWGYGMGRGDKSTCRSHFVAVKMDICETWQIREVASPQAGVQGRGGAIRVKNVEVGPLVDWALSSTTWRLGDSVVVGGDLNAHVGYMRHTEREALNLERDHGGMWRVSPCVCELQRRALVQVLSRSAHGDGEHALPWRWLHTLE